MIEQFKELYKVIDKAEDDISTLLSKSVGHKYNLVNNEGLKYELYIEYFRGFDRIGVVQYFNEQGECVNDEWCIADLYDAIKNSNEIN